MVSAAMQVTASVTGALPVLTVTTTSPPIPVSPKAATPAAQTVVLNFPIPLTTAPAGVTTDSLPAALIRDSSNLLQIVPADSDLVLAVAAGGAGTADIELTVDWF